MPKKFYLDTATWRDYFEDRGNGIRPLGEFAFQFLRRCRERKHTVIVSNEVVRELLGHYSEGDVKQVFSGFEDIIVWLDYTKEQAAEAYSFWIKTNKRFPSSDILHSIIARDNNAIVISRDAHFREIGIAECLFPEEVD